MGRYIVITLYKGNCLEIMKDIPNKSIDMILCDVPYGATRNKSDKRLPFAPLWKQYKRIIKDNGCIVLFTQGKPLHGKGTAYKTKEMQNNNYGDFNALEDMRKGSIDKYPTSILQFTKPHPSTAKHRTEKPVALLEYLIKTYTNESETVLDNCMGSGSTGVACKITNRNFIGIELNDEYFEIAKEQIGER